MLLLNANHIDSVDSGHPSGFCPTAHTLNISLGTKRLHRQAQIGYNAWTSVHSVSSWHNGCDVASVSSARPVFIDTVITLLNNSWIVHKRVLEWQCLPGYTVHTTTPRPRWALSQSVRRASVIEIKHLNRRVWRLALHTAHGHHVPCHYICLHSNSAFKVQHFEAHLKNVGDISLHLLWLLHMHASLHYSSVHARIALNERQWHRCR